MESVEKKFKCRQESSVLNMSNHISRRKQYKGTILTEIVQNHFQELKRDFPGGAVVKNPPANAGDVGLSPGPGRSHMPRSN